MSDNGERRPDGPFIQAFNEMKSQPGFMEEFERVRSGPGPAPAKAEPEATLTPHEREVYENSLQTLRSVDQWCKDHPDRLSGAVMANIKKSIAALEAAVKLPDDPDPYFSTPCPDPALKSPFYCLAVSGEGAFAVVVESWEGLLRGFAGALWSDGSPSNNPDQWAEWMELFSDLDEWHNDEAGNPFGFSTDLGETSKLSIFRLSWTPKS